MPWPQLARTMLLDVVGGAVARLAALHVDDRAEAALERAAAAGVETGDASRMSRARRRRGRNGMGCASQARQVVHVIVERLQPAARGRRAAARPAALRPRRRRAQMPSVQRLAELGRQLRQHREAAADVEAADDDLDARRDGTAGADRARAGTGWSARRPGRPAHRSRHCA